MKLLLVIYILLACTQLNAKELFTKEMIPLYLSESNPFIYAAIGEENIYKERETYYLGDLDTKLSLNYDNKDYPISNGEYLNVGVNKVLENGTQLIASYRKAEGTQEYNNIKTSDDGEVLAGVRIPLLEVINGMNKIKLDINSAALDRKKYGFKSQNNLRNLYYKIIRQYMEVVYNKSIVQLQNELLQKAQKRESIIKKRVKVGSLAQITLLEAEQQIINREQNFVTSKNKLENSLEIFIRYLNLSQGEFKEHYKLGDILNIEYADIDLEAYIDLAISKRADLKMYDFEIKKIDLQKQQTELLKYPKLDIGLYGVHDFKDENGYKVTVNMNFPLERRKFDGEYAQNKNSRRYIQMNKEKEILNIKTSLTNIVNTLHALKSNIESSKEEINLVEKLETSENRKYFLGLSNLFMVNQREIYTLEIKKKALKYNFEYLILEQEANKEVGLVLLGENIRLRL